MAITLGWLALYIHIPHTGSSVDFTAMCNLALLTEFEDTPVLLQCGITLLVCVLYALIALCTDPEKQENIDIFGRVVTNICDQTRNITVLGRPFLIPSKSTFLLSDLCQVCQLYNYAGL